MKRWRPPPRPLILIALLLLVGGGAVVNVAVAWVLVGAPDSWTRGKPLRLDEAPRWAIDAPPCTGDETIGYSIRLSRSVAGAECVVSLMRLNHFPSESRPFYVASESRTLATGWPLLCLRMCQQRKWDGPATAPRELGAPRELAINSRLAGLEVPGGGALRLPLDPVPAGFAINTLFYAAIVGAILALPLSFFPIRRQLRARRNRCPKCGYDRTGLEQCPECGATS